MGVPEVILVGLGPGPLSLLTREAEALLLGARRVLFRFSAHPAYAWLRDRGADLIAFDAIYATPRMRYEDVYAFIADAVLKEARRTGQAVYALPGHPFVFETPSALILEGAAANGIQVRVIPGMSFLDLLFAELRVDAAGVEVCNAIEFSASLADLAPHGAVVIGGLLARGRPAGGEPENVAFVNRWLASRFPHDHVVALVWTTGMPDYRTSSARTTVAQFSAACAALPRGAFASAYVPPP